MIEYLNSLDTKLFLLINGWHESSIDPIMYWLSDKLIWVPMYLLIIVFIIKRYKIHGVLMILFIGITITLCDQTASGILKNLTERLRPSHEPALAGLVHLSKAGPRGLYGFASSHAANSFGLATFLFFALDKPFNPLKYWLFTWAFLVSYSRIYNGVHYPGDILAGALIGFLYGYLIAYFFKKTSPLILKKWQQPNNQTNTTTNKPNNNI